MLGYKNVRFLNEQEKHNLLLLLLFYKTIKMHSTCVKIMYKKLDFQNDKQLDRIEELHVQRHVTFC